MPNHKLTEKQKKTLKSVRENAKRILELCDKAEGGKVSGEEFEKILSKQFYGGNIGYGAW